MSKVAVVALLLFTLTALSDSSNHTIFKRFDVQPFPNEEDITSILRTGVPKTSGRVGRFLPELGKLYGWLREFTRRVLAGS